MKSFVIVLLLLAVSCAPPPVQNQTLYYSSLKSVEKDRPMVRLKRLSGEACGCDAVDGAIIDMQRLEVDGYIDVVVNVRSEGNERCATASAVPFKYGTNDSLPSLDLRDKTRGGGPASDQEVIRDATPCGNVDAVTKKGHQAACQHIATLYKEGAMKGGLAVSRCVDQHCTSPLGTFALCIRDAGINQAALQSCIDSNNGEE